MYVPDCNFRKRDPRFKTAPRHKEKKRWGKQIYTNVDFTYVSDGDYFKCPAGNKLLKSNSDLSNNGVTYCKYLAKQRFCNSCNLRPKCIEHNGAPIELIEFEKDMDFSILRKEKKISSDILNILNNQKG